MGEEIKNKIEFLDVENTQNKNHFDTTVYQKPNLN